VPLPVQHVRKCAFTCNTERVLQVKCYARSHCNTVAAGCWVTMLPGACSASSCHSIHFQQCTVGDGELQRTLQASHYVSKKLMARTAIFTEALLCVLE
jgi:hypothetical protein